MRDTVSLGTLLFFAELVIKRVQNSIDVKPETRE